MSGKAIEIALLGELSVRREGQAVGLPASRKTRALLGFLVLSGTPQPRARLCELLWEGPVDPRAELRWSLSKLRALVSDEREQRITMQDDAIAFRAAGAFVDLHAVDSVIAGGEEAGDARGAADLTRLARTAALFRGELLSGLELPDCFRFNAWLTAERERLFTLRTRLHERLASLEAQPPQEALRWARSWVAIDPLAEKAHAAAVRALLALGRRRDAQAQVETCRRILRQELGVGTSGILDAARSQPALTGSASPALAETALTSARSATPTATAIPTVSQGAEEGAPGMASSRGLVSDEVTFVGRDAELAELEQALETAQAGADGSATDRAAAISLLLVDGEPGIGKSRLLREVARGAQRRGFAVLHARGFETEVTRPFGVWLALVPEGGESHPLVDLAPELAGEIASGGWQTDPGQFHRRVVEALAVQDRPGTPLLLVLDDLQWVDESTLALVHALLRAPGIPGLVVAAGLRPGEAAAQSAAARLLRDRERDGSLLRVALGPLAAEASLALVHAVTDRLAPNAADAAGASDSDSSLSADAAVLAATSAGHPLYAIELARCTLELAAGLPASLQAAVGERLARVGTAGRTLLAFAAAVGGGFDVELLARLTGLPAAELLPALDELEGGAIVRASSDGRSYDFAHDIVRRVAYEQIPPPRRRFLHAEIARTLAARPDADGALAGTLARQAALGGLDLLASEACLSAAERCLRVGALTEAEEQGERGLGHLASLNGGETLGLRFALLRTLVHATQGRPRREGIAAEVRRWVEVARAAGRKGELQIGLYLLAALFYAEDDLSAAERHVLDEAEALRGAEPRVAAKALANAGRCLAQIERDHARAEALLREGRELASRAGVELVDIPWGLAMVAQAAGRDEEARREFARALELARAAGDPWIEGQCIARLAAMALEQGEHDVALASSAELARLAERIGEPGDAAVAFALAALARFQMDEPGAESELATALTALRAADSKMHLAFVLNRAAERDLAAGRVDLAESRADEALACAARIGRRGQTACARLLLARIAELRGDRARARRELAAAAEQNRPAGALGGRTWTEIESWQRRLAGPTLAPTALRQRSRREKGATG